MLQRYMPLSRIVMIMAVAAIVIGIVFIYMGVSKTYYIRDQMAAEKVPVSIAGGNATGYIDSASTAQEVADTIKKHRQSIAPTYSDLLAQSGGRYDPTNPKDLSYTQALNMENYLYMGVFALGFTQAVTAIGVFMILVGIALMAVWAAIRNKKKVEEVRAKSP
jgi:uncharacterized membrane protein